VLNQSAYRIPAGDAMTVPVFVYNFGSGHVQGKLSVQTPDGWIGQMAREVALEPGERRELSLALSHPAISSNANVEIRVTGRFGNGGGKPVLAFHLTSATK